MPKYFYTCPIKALYMMKEFRVEFKTKHQSQYNKECFFRAFSQLWVDGMDCSDDSVRICSLINAEDNDITRVTDRIYVIEGSEDIFEPEVGDIFSYKMFGRVATYILPENQCGKEWAKEANEIKIIIRAGKQFFMPEVEKELEQEKTMQLHASSGKFGQEKEIINN